MMLKQQKRGQGHWTQIVGGLLAAVVIIVSVILLKGPAQAGKGLFECNTQGGVCADEVSGNTGGVACPEESGGYRWVTLEPKCKKGNREYACCLRGTSATPAPQQQPAGINARSLRVRTEAEARQAADTASEIVARGRAQDDTGALLDGYDTAKTAITMRFNEFAFSRAPTPLDYTTIKGFESISIATEYLRNQERIGNPYPAMCRIWAMMFRGYAEGYWDDAAYGLGAFHEETKRRLNQHADDSRTDSYCQLIMAMSVTDLQDCKTAIVAQQAAGLSPTPPDYQDFRPETEQACDTVMPLLQDNTLDFKQPAPAFSIETYFTELDALLQPLRGQHAPANR